jgi:hypothetical protein
MSCFHASSKDRTAVNRFDRGCPELASRPDLNWQAGPDPFPHGIAGIAASPPRPSLYPFVRGQLMVCQSLSRTLGCSDRTWRERNRLGAGEAAAPLLRAGGSASAPYRRARPAAFIGGGIVGVARRSRAAATSGRQEGA